MTAGPDPVPVTLTLCWLPETLLLLSVTVNNAVRLPAPPGVKVTLTVQELLAAREEPQVLVCAKSPGFVPVNAIPLMARAEVPVLLRETVWAPLVVPIFWLLKVRLEVAKVAKGALPVPLKFKVCGLFVALSVRISDAVRVPGPVGVKVIVMVQVPPAATELPQVFVSEKSPEFVPVTVMPVMLNAMLPVLFRVNVCEEPAAPTA